MPRVLSILLASLMAWFRSHLSLQLELIALRHQVAVYKQSISRPKLQPADRFIWVWLTNRTYKRHIIAGPSRAQP